MSMRINLLPHREMRRERRKKDYVGLLAFVGIGAAAAAVVVALGIDQRIDAQRARNDFIRAENAKLDEQIKEIDKLRDQIQQVLARKQVVEELQANRSEAVHLLDQIVRQLPDGIYLKSLKQGGTRVQMVGYAQSNARVSTLMRNIEASPWVASPELVEIKLVNLPGATRGAPAQQVNEFTLNFQVKRAPPVSSAPAPARPGAPVPAKSAASGAKA